MRLSGPTCSQFNGSIEQFGLYLADLLGNSETGVHKLVFCQFPIAEGEQSLVVVTKVSDVCMLNLLNLCPDFKSSQCSIRPNSVQYGFNVS